MPSPGRQVGWAIAAALGSATCFGLNPPAARLGVLNGIPPVESVLFRTAAFLAVAVAFLVLSGQRFAVPRQTWARLAILAAAATLVSLAYLSSVAFIPVTLAVILFYTYPLAILIAAPLVEGAAVGARRFALAAVAFAGLGLAIAPTFEALDWRGLALAGLASLGAMLLFFTARSLAGGASELALGFWVHLPMLPVALGFALAAGQGSLQIAAPSDLTAGGLVALAMIGATYPLAFVLNLRALRHAPASTVVPFFNLEPLVSAAAAAVILGERLAVQQYAGVALVLAAVLLLGFLARS